MGTEARAWLAVRPAQEVGQHVGLQGCRGLRRLICTGWKAALCLAGPGFPRGLAFGCGKHPDCMWLPSPILPASAPQDLAAGPWERVETNPADGHLPKPSPTPSFECQPEPGLEALHEAEPGARGLWLHHPICPSLASAICLSVVSPVCLLCAPGGTAGWARVISSQGF